MNLPTIIIDTREQCPLSFPEGVETRTEGLHCGDYSLDGLTELCAIERKSLPDLVACCCNSERQRFKRELHRLQSYRCRTVVVEASFQDATQGNYRSKLNPNALIASVSSWQIRYSVPFIWAGDSNGAATVTLEILRQFYRQCRQFARSLKVAQ